MIMESIDPLGLVAQLQEQLVVLGQQIARPDAPLQAALIEDLANFDPIANRDTWIDERLLIDRECLFCRAHIRGVYLEVIANRLSAHVLHSAACVWWRARALSVGRRS